MIVTFSDSNLPKQEPITYKDCDLYINYVDDNGNITTRKIDKSKCIEVKLGNSDEGLDILFNQLVDPSYINNYCK